jgi:ribulose-bisphosphate carboxylase large chain
MALDQTNRYTNLSLKEEDLINDGNHVLVAYKMAPKKGYGNYLETAAHFAAESSTGTNVDVSTTDDFTKGVDAIVYQIDEATELMKIAYPVDLFDRNIIDGRAMIASFLTLAIGNNQGMGDVDHGKMYDFYIPPKYLALFDGPSTSIQDLWRVLGRPVVDGGFIVGTIIKPKLG